MKTTVFDRFDKPACAETLGWKLVEEDADRGEIRIQFEGRPAFCNPSGVIQGGFLAAMLDDCMGPAVLVKTNGEFFTATIDLGVQFIAPAKCGALFGTGRVISLGKRVGFVSGELRDQDGKLVAVSTASVRLIPASSLSSGELINK